MTTPARKKGESRRKGLLLRLLPSRIRWGKHHSNKPEPTLANTNSISPLLQLPGELRTLIYEYAFTLSTEERLRIAQYYPIHLDASSLLLTCKQIRHEVGQLPYLSAVAIIWPWGEGWKELSQTPFRLTTNSRDFFAQALQTRPKTIKNLAMGLSLSNHGSWGPVPIDHLIDTAILNKGGVQPKEFIIRLCICHDWSTLSSNLSAIMPFCIALERLAMHLPTLERIVMYYCRQKWPKGTQEREIVPFPKIVYDRQVIRGSSGANWSPRSIEEEGTHRRTELVWTAAPHPGQALEDVPWTSRTVAIDFYDSQSVSGFLCVRDRPNRIQYVGIVTYDKPVLTNRLVRSTRSKQSKCAGTWRRTQLPQNLSTYSNGFPMDWIMSTMSGSLLMNRLLKNESTRSTALHGIHRSKRTDNHESLSMCRFRRFSCGIIINHHHHHHPSS
jgi:hypothetical protein